MLRAGAILLSLWTGFNLVLALAILFLLLVRGQNAPCLLILYGNTQPVGLDLRALATINALAVLLNACAAAICALSLSVIWLALVRRAVWAFWSLSASLLFLQVAGFASDRFLGDKDLPANVASSLLLLVGVCFTAIGMFRFRHPGR
jgi:hypothetical protein